MRYRGLELIEFPDPPKVTEEDKKFLDYLEKYCKFRIEDFLLPASVLGQSKQHSYTEMMANRMDRR